MHWRHEQLSPRMLLASVRHHSWQSGASVGVQTAPAPVAESVAPAPMVEHAVHAAPAAPAPAPVVPDPAVHVPLLAATHAATATPAPVNEHVASELVIMDLESLLGLLVPVVQVVQAPQVQAIENIVTQAAEPQIVETRSFVNDTVPQIRETREVISERVQQRTAEHSEGVPQIAKESVEIEMPGPPVSEQTVDDVDAAILRREEWMRDQRVNIVRCVNVLKVKQEDVEQYEKEAALLVRIDGGCFA